MPRLGSRVRVSFSALFERMLEWWNGRHEGLKILWPLRLCGFKSRSGYEKSLTTSRLSDSYIFRYLWRYAKLWRPTWTQPTALRRSATTPPARPRERSRFQLTPDSVGGTRTDAHAPRSAAADAHLPHIYSGTALRCRPLHHTSPGRGPGLTENGTALRCSIASPVVAHLRSALAWTSAIPPRTLR